MYTQIVLLLFALHAVSAYTVVQIELKNDTISNVKEIENNTMEFNSPESKLPTLREIIFVVEEYLGKPDDKGSTKQKTSQEKPIELDASLRPFTNGHGYQFADWELIDEHQSRTDDKAEDKTDNDSDSDDDADDYDDTDDETDKHDDHHEVPTPVIDPRHLDIDKVKKSRNNMFDKIKEKYQSIKRSNVRIDPTEKLRRKRQLNYQGIPGAPYNVDPTAYPDHMTRMLMNRPYFDNSKPVISPIFREDYGNNFLYDNYNMNSVLADGRQFVNVPRSYGTNQNTDQLYYLNYINNMQNEPNYNQYFYQPAQQRSTERHTVNNNNPYKQIKQSNKPDMELRNVKPIPVTDINGMESIQKFNQVQDYEPLNRVPKEIESKNKNVTQITDKEKVRNNGEANMTLRQSVEMRNSVNQMSKKIGSIKEKVKDRIANITGMLNTPEGRKLVTYTKNTAGDRVRSSNDTTVQQVSVNGYIPKDSKNLTKNDKLEIKPKSTIVTNNVRDAHNMQTKKDGANNSFIEYDEPKDKEVIAEMKKSEKNLVNSDTANKNYISNQTIVETLITTGNETTKIEKDKESSLVQTIVEKKIDQPESSSPEIFNGTGNETTNIKKDNESSLLQTIVENKYSAQPEPITDTLTGASNDTTNIENNKESSLVPTRIVENKYDQPETPTNETSNEATNIQKDKESSLFQTIVENKYSGQPKPPTNEPLTGTGNKTTNIEKDKESSLLLTIVENKYIDQPKPPTNESFTGTDNKTTNIEKDKESSLFQTIVDNKYIGQPKPPTNELFTGTSNKTTNIEKDKESSLLQAIVENKYSAQPEPITDTLTGAHNDTTNIENNKESSLVPTRIAENKYDQPETPTNETSDETTTIEKDKESSLIQTIVENKYSGQPKPPTNESLTGTGNKTTNIEKDKESSLLQAIVENKYSAQPEPITDTLTGAHNDTTNIENNKESSLVPTRIAENKYDQPETPTNETSDETTTIDKEKESSLIQTIVENKYSGQPKPPTNESLTGTGNKTTNIEKDKEFSLLQTILENKYDQLEPPVAETLNATGNQTMNSEKDQESPFLPKTIESFNDTSTTDIKEARSELIDEITEKTGSFAANKTDESCNNKEKCHIDDNNKKDKYFENLNYDEFFNKKKFKADDNKIDNKSENLHLDDLFNKDEFWNWLSKWTTAYMGILNENVEIIVKGEVAKRMEEIYSRTGKGKANQTGESNTHEDLDKRRR